MGDPSAEHTATRSWTKVSSIEIRVEPPQIEPLANYLIGVLERNPYLSQLTKSTHADGVLIQYRLIASDGSLLDVAVKITADRTLVYYAPYPEGSASNKDLVELDMELETILRSYFQDQSKSSLYLVFSPKMNILPGAKERGIKKLLASVVFGNILYLFLIILFAGLVLYQFFYEYTPLLLVAMQFVIVFFANNLIAARGEFDITPENHSIHIAELRMKRQEFDQVLKSCLPKISEIKKKIYDSTLALGNELDEKTVVRILNDYGAACTPEFVRIKTVNVYNIVSDLSRRFGFKEPRITLLNVLPPNAAATGVSPRRATVLLTTGLIAGMEEPEIKTVLAHEFSHIKARDPLVLLSLATAEYLTRVYIVWPALFQFGLIVTFLYLFLSFTILFFVAKFLEARADLDASVATGEPKLLASSLRKLGLWKYQSRVFEMVNTGEWLKWDPHPPLYYRIRVLESLDTSRLRHTFIEAVRGCIKGFIASFSDR
ncbi:MAG: M56 family metallopeptidase [Candidatus Verstraetearchaeota archaeon]|nr:M56 family metallopeptidase [Candidatus Verstraetearchaeota archaeon]